MKILQLGLCVAVMFSTSQAWSADRESLRSKLVGIWYGQRGSPDAENAEWLMDQRADGYFILHVRTYVGCKLIRDSREAGKWTVEGNVQRTFMEFADGVAVNDRGDGDYEILDIDQQQMRYRHIGTGIEFRSLRGKEGDSLSKSPACQT